MAVLASGTREPTLSCTDTRAWLRQVSRYTISLPSRMPRLTEMVCFSAKSRISGEPRQSFALADAAEAHRALESRQTTGATVLVP